MKFLLEGLLILAKYWPDSINANAQHDVVYLGGSVDAMTEEDAAQLKAIPHWQYCDGFECWQFNT